MGYEGNMRQMYCPLFSRGIIFKAYEFSRPHTLNDAAVNRPTTEHLSPGAKLILQTRWLARPPAVR